MARGEIKIPIAVDTSGISKEIDNGLVEPLEDAEDALKALSKVDAGKDLERDLERAADATDELKDELDDTRDQLKKLGYAAKDAGDDAKRGMDGAGEGVEEFGDEARSTAKEAAASFNGSAEDIVDAFQEVAANAFAGFGPAGMLAGLAIAAGIGIATQAFNDAEEAAEELRQKANEYANQAIDAGTSTDAWLRSSEQVVERIRELQDTKDNGFRLWFMEDPDNLEKWTKALRDMGRETSEVEDVLSGSTDQMEDYRDAIEESRDALKKQFDALIETGDGATEAGQKKMDAIQEELGATNDLLGLLDDEIEIREKSEAARERQTQAGIDAVKERAAAEEEAADAIKGALESVEASALGAYDSMRQGAYDKATADDAAFDTNKWLEYVEQTRSLADGYKANLATMKLTPAEWENFLALPEDARQNIAASYQSAGEEGKTRIRSALSDTGSTTGNEATVGFNESFNPEADVDVEVDTRAAESAMKDVTKKRTAEIEVKTTGKADAKSALDDLAKRRHATIDVKADTSSASSTVNSWRRGQEARPIYVTVKARTGGQQLV